MFNIGVNEIRVKQILATAKKAKIVAALSCVGGATTLGGCTYWVITETKEWAREVRDLNREKKEIHSTLSDHFQKIYAGKLQKVEREWQEVYKLVQRLKEIEQEQKVTPKRITVESTPEPVKTFKFNIGEMEKLQGSNPREYEVQKFLFDSCKFSLNEAECGEALEAYRITAIENNE